MARTTLYCVDTYQRGARGKLVPGDHREMKTASEVVQRAEYLFAAGKAVGAMAYEIEADHEFEDYSEPRVLIRLGDTPEA